MKFNRIQKVLIQILKCLALQIGKEVSLSEIALTVNIDKRTVVRYLELTKSKYFFYDLGIRNACINNFNSIVDRADFGDLFENFTDFIS